MFKLLAQFSKLMNLNRSTNFLKMAGSSVVPVNKAKQFENEAVIVHNEENDNIRVTLFYSNTLLNIQRTFNFNRKANEQCSLLLKRMSENITKFLIKRNHSKGNKNRTQNFATNEEIVNVKVELCHNDETDELPEDASCYDILIKSGDKYHLKIEDEAYSLNVNPPILTVMDLPKKTIMANCLLYPRKIEGINFDLSDTQFFWYRSRKKYQTIEEANSDAKSWEKVHDGFCVLVTDDDIGRLFKVVCIPYKGKREGTPSDAVSKILVSAGPGRCPFQSRSEKFITDVLGCDKLRVLSYNILADMYADSEFSRNTLFPTCPPEALAMEYRKQLIIKEILGYKADIMCLQEVDEKVFQRDLRPVFSQFGLAGRFAKKGGQVGEGTAIFFREEKLRLEAEHTFILKDELVQNPLFSELLEKIQQNEKAFEVISARQNTLQVCSLAVKSDQMQTIVVATTHLYFDPLSDYIRLIQAWVSLVLLQQLLELNKIKHPTRKVSLIFCGDFNSVPENAVFRLMTSQFIGDDDADWRSKPEQELSGITLSHSLEMESACGTPLYTNYTLNFNGCLDYIFYETDHLAVERMIPFPSNEEVIANRALPSITFPSDHLALIADFKWKNR